jgi:predicted RNase H-like HicB family nuclease
MLLKNDHYTYRVIWSEDDNEYVGLCAEFPSLSWLSESQEDALKGICNIVADVINDMKENGEKIPQPIAAKVFRKEKQMVTTKRLNIANVQKSHNILSSIKGSLSDDIYIEQEERC